MKADTETCAHKLTLAVAERAEGGYRIRCLTCGEAGPEREDVRAAFDAYDAVGRRRSR